TGRGTRWRAPGPWTRCAWICQASRRSSTRTRSPATARPLPPHSAARPPCPCRRPMACRAWPSSCSAPSLPSPACRRPTRPTATRRATTTTTSRCRTTAPI
ncbi:hypothetical protein IWQ57_006884, partial [Coemansia nantahalensis]